MVDKPDITLLRVLPVGHSPGTRKPKRLRRSMSASAIYHSLTTGTLHLSNAAPRLFLALCLRWELRSLRKVSVRSMIERAGPECQTLPTPNQGPTRFLRHLQFLKIRFTGLGRAGAVLAVAQHWDRPSSRVREWQTLFRKVVGYRS
jgi:hypothetical protein